MIVSIAGGAVVSGQDLSWRMLGHVKNERALDGLSPFVRAGLVDSNGLTRSHQIQPGWTEGAER